MTVRRLFNISKEWSMISYWYSATVADGRKIVADIGIDLLNIQRVLGPEKTILLNAQNVKKKKKKKRRQSPERSRTFDG